jgi:flagellin-like protein
MKRKGISPLIAAVLLIAFTMAVAAILTAWVTTFTQDTTSEISNESSRLVQCSFGGLSIYDVTAGSGQITVQVANTGTREFTQEVVVTATDSSGNTNQSRIPGGMETGDVVSTNVGLSGVSNDLSDIDQVEVRSVECPEVTDNQVSFS